MFRHGQEGIINENAVKCQTNPDQQKFQIIPRATSYMVQLFLTLVLPVA
jgi:hypothetical protein